MAILPDHLASRCYSANVCLQEKYRNRFIGVDEQEIARIFFSDKRVDGTVD